MYLSEVDFLSLVRVCKDFQGDMALFLEQSVYFELGSFFTCLHLDFEVVLGQERVRMKREGVRVVLLVLRDVHFL